MRKYGVIYIVAMCCWVMVMLGGFFLFVSMRTTQFAQPSGIHLVATGANGVHAHVQQQNSLSVADVSGIGFMALLPIGFGIMILGSLMFWIFAIIHVAKNDRLKDNERIVWILVVVLLHTLGATVYFLAAPEPLPRLRQS